MTSGWIAWSCLCVIFGAWCGIGAEDDIEIAKFALVAVFIGLCIAFGAWAW
jgi:hypothetical protein